MIKLFQTFGVLLCPTWGLLLHSRILNAFLLEIGCVCVCVFLFTDVSPASDWWRRVPCHLPACKPLKVFFSSRWMHDVLINVPRWTRTAPDAPRLGSHLSTRWQDKRPALSFQYLTGALWIWAPIHSSWRTVIIYSYVSGALFIAGEAAPFSR